MEIECSPPKKYFGHTTYLQSSVPRKAGDCFSGQSNGRHKAQFIFIACTNGRKVLEEMTSLKETYVLTTLGKKSMKVRSESKHASKPTILHIA